MNLWAQALEQLGREPTEFQIAAMLGAAFLVLMVVEGLRASFLPHRPKERRMATAPTAAAETLTAMPLEDTQIGADPGPAAIGGTPYRYAATRANALRNRKRERHGARAWRAPRPSIRRAAALTIKAGEETTP